MISASNNFYYIFDAEGTLFFTDDLNNESYNYALLENNLQPIANRHRITRKTIIDVYNLLNKSQLDKIIQQKQEYFINHIDKISGNHLLFNILSKIDKNKSILWTASDRKKMEHVLSNFNMKFYFKEIIFSDKKDISKDLKKFCDFFHCTHEQLLIFENDISIAEELNILRINCLLGSADIEKNLDWGKAYE